MNTQSQLTATTVFVGIIAAYFLLHIVLLAWWSLNFRGQTKMLADLFRQPARPGSDPFQPVEAAPRMIRSFLYHLVEINGQPHRTTDSAVFLSDAEVLGWSIHSKYLAAIPSQLLGIGIAGTFFALRGALAQLSDVPTVASRTGDALLTSLAGLSASIGFAIILSARSAVLRVDLTRLAQILDQRYPLVTLESLQARSSEQSIRLQASLPGVLDHVLSERLLAIQQQLAGALGAFESAWSSSVNQTLANWVREFEAGALAAVKSYQAEVDRQRTIVMARIDHELEFAGERFSATLRRAVTDVRAESIRAFSSGFDQAKTEFGNALKAMTTALSKSASGIVAEINAASGSARQSADAIKTSFDDVRKQIEGVRQDIELGAGKAITAFEQRVRLLVEQAATESVLISDAHREAVTAEFEALKAWTERLRLEIDQMLAGFSRAMTSSVDRIIRTQDGQFGHSREDARAKAEGRS